MRLATEIGMIKPIKYSLAMCSGIFQSRTWTGATITNISATEPIVMLKHFAENPELVIK